MKTRSLLCGAAIASAIAALSPGEARADLGRVRSSGQLRWGADQEGGGPYVFPRDDAPDQVTGFEVDLAAQIARRMGVRPAFTQGAWDKLPDMLRTGKIDVVLNGYELTAEKLETMSPSVPYYVFSLQLLARKGDGRFSSWADLAKRPGGARTKVGVLTASAAESTVRRRCGEACELVSYDGNTDAMREVETGKLDATVQDTPIAAFYGPRFPGLVPVGEPEGKGYYVAFVRKGDEPLRRAVDEAILAAVLSGEMERIDRHYGIWDDRQREVRQIAEAARFYGAAPLTQSSQPAPPSQAGQAGGAGAAPGPSAASVPSGTTPATSPPSEPEIRLGERKRGLSVALAYGGVLLKSAGLTVVLSVLSFPLAIALGLLVAIGRLYGPRWLASALGLYVELLRGTPLMLQLYFVFFMLPEVGVTIPAFWTGVLGLAINYSAYESEIYRAGLQAVPHGQMEAALSLGMPRSLAIRRIIVPQAVRMVIPPVVNDFIALFKDTSVCSVITLVELTKRFSVLSQSTQATVELMALTALLYLAMSYPLSLVSRRLERSLGVGATA